MCDANSAYIGTDNFFRDNKLKRKESEMVYGRKINKNEWNSNTVQMLESHEFYTDYMSPLDIKKNENLEKLKKENKTRRHPFVPNAVTSMPEGKK